MTLEIIHSRNCKLIYSDSRPVVDWGQNEGTTKALKGTLGMMNVLTILMLVINLDMLKLIHCTP